MKRWILAVGGLVCVFVLEARAEYPTLKARPKPLEGVPNYPYQSSSQPPHATVTGTGQARVGLGTPGEMLPTTELPVASSTTTRDTSCCKLVRSLLKTERTEQRDRTTTTTSPGVMSFALPGEAATFAMKERELRVDHCSVSGISVTLYPDGHYSIRYRAEQGAPPSSPYKRNQFVLTVRGYAADTLGEPRGNATKAAVLQIPLEPVWVKRGETHSGFAEGVSDAVKRNYRWIDRVDMDFTYR